AGIELAYRGTVSGTGGFLYMGGKLSGDGDNFSEQPASFSRLPARCRNGGGLAGRRPLFAARQRRSRLRAPADGHLRRQLHIDCRERVLVDRALPWQLALRLASPLVPHRPRGALYGPGLFSGAVRTFAPGSIA